MGGHAGAQSIAMALRVRAALARSHAACGHEVFAWASAGTVPTWLSLDV